MDTPQDANEHLPHPLLNKHVRDIASGREGILMAVVQQNMGTLADHWVEVAYIRPVGGGVETSTAATNIVAAL